MRHDGFVRGPAGLQVQAHDLEGRGGGAVRVEARAAAQLRLRLPARLYCFGLELCERQTAISFAELFFYY